MNTDNFIFTNQHDFIEDDNTFLAYIPKVTTMQDILHVYSSALKFPTYVSNWDALYDWLTDLDWIKEKDIIIIIHKNPPFLDKKIK